MNVARIVVVGAGICGLGTSLLLARDGHDVTVLERDDRAVPDSARAAWDSWTRKGVAQFQQPHNFMPGLRALLEAELPDVQEALRAAGAAKFDLVAALPSFWTDKTRRPIDDQLWTLTARRPTGEWVVRDAAARQPRLTLRSGVDVESLLPGKSARAGVPHVAGVTTRDGETLRADLVVDATGRGSKSSKWLAAIGATPPYEESEDCGFTYYTRFFRGTIPLPRSGPLTPFGTVSLLTLPGDNDTWSVTFYSASDDKPTRRLREPDVWTRAVRAFPLHAHWLDGEPITEIKTMSGIVDRYRRFVVDGRPVATGFVAVADASACTNPSAGRGLTVGFRHGALLRDALRESNGDPLALVARFDELTEARITPWVRAQIAWDRTRFATMRALADGREPPPPRDELAGGIGALLACMPADPDLFRAGLEYVGTLTPVQDILRRSDVQTKMTAAMKSVRASGPPPALPGPNREQLLALVA
jgi:2-polyprenyl-6-methoxyphenol hydroxylase-like FAD-dependent oxidoreductase